MNKIIIIFLSLFFIRQVNSQKMDSVMEIQHKKHISFLKKEFNDKISKDSFLLFLFTYIKPIPVHKMSPISGEKIKNYGNKFYLNYEIEKWMNFIFKKPLIKNYSDLSYLYYSLYSEEGDMDLIYYTLKDSIYEYNIYETGNAYLIKLQGREKKKRPLNYFYTKFNFDSFKKDSNVHKIVYGDIIMSSNILDYNLNGEWYNNITVFENATKNNVHILIMKTWEPRQSIDFIHLRNNWITPILDSCYKKPEKQYKIRPLK